MKDMEEEKKNTVEVEGKKINKKNLKLDYISLIKTKKAIRFENFKLDCLFIRNSTLQQLVLIDH